MDDDRADLLNLAQTGLKATLPRMKVLEVFRASAQRHLAAEDIYRLLVAERADIGLATIYRVLAQFEQAGLLKKSQLGVNKAVYELNDREHHHGHLVCIGNGDVHEFFDPGIEERLKAIAAELGFEFEDYVLTVFARPMNRDG